MAKAVWGGPVLADVAAQRAQPILFPIGAIAIAAAVHLLTDIPDDVPGDIRRFGAAFLAAGVGLVLWAIFGQTGAGNNPEVNAPTQALVTTGAYRLTRNPIYLGMVIAQGGLCLWLTWWFGLAIAPVTLVALDRFIVRWEEQSLSDQFGDAYDVYRGRVRRWL